MRDSTIFYRSFYEALKELPAINQAEIYNAIFEYSLNFNLIELQGLSKTIFTLIKPQLDANIKRYYNGTTPKEKQEISKTEAKGKQKESKTEANANVNLNLNENQNVNDIITYLNSVLGTKYKNDSRETLKVLNARFKEGYVYEDFKKVIDLKFSEWNNDIKMKTYLRPETLFGNKFESYLNQQTIVSEAPKKMFIPEW